MRKLATRMLSLLLVACLLAGMVPTAFAATYRPGAQSGPSSSYASGMYYSNYKRVPITGDNRTDLVAIALSQLGYQEGAANGYFSGLVSGRNNYVEFSYNMGDLGLGYGGSDYPWCASFVSWCLYQSHCTDQNSWKDLGRYHVGDYKYIWKEISCSQWVRQLKGAGYYKYSRYEGGSYTPKYGDLVFFQNSGGVAHIGICLYVANGRIYTVEGNTSDSSGLEANGGGVYFKNYAIGTSYINGYGVLPYKSNSSVTKIDYSGNNPTPGLYVANASKYIYPTETATSHSWVMSRFTMFEVTQVCSNGRLKVIAKNSAGNTVTGYISNNSDRVIQLSTTATDAVDTARANLQKEIKSAEGIRHYNYPEATILEIRNAYNNAVSLVGSSSATEAQLNSAAATLRNLLGQTGSNTIALNNQGIYINGRNSFIQAGDCFLYSPTWNNGLITVDNANIRYTINVVCTWDAQRQINVVKSISYGSGNSTPAIQLDAADFLIACHNWETGVAASDNPVEYSGTNYKILSNLSVGDGIRLSGVTALNAGTDVAPGAFLKFLPVDAARISGENSYVYSGAAGLFTPSFGTITDANAGIGSTVNVLAQWDAEKSAWIVRSNTVGGTEYQLASDQVLLTCHPGESTATQYYYDRLAAAKVGQKVIFSGISPTDGTTNVSVAANVSFVDVTVEDEPADEVVLENLALNKDYVALDPGTAAHIGNLTDGNFVTGLDFTGGWFGFAGAGANKNTDDNGNGYVTVDLGSVYKLDSARAHLFFGYSDASIGQPSYINVYTSANDVDYQYVGALQMDPSSAISYWAELEGLTGIARYVRFEVGPAADATWVFLNEVEVYGAALTGEENIAFGTTVQTEGYGSYTADLVDGILGETINDGAWYGIDTTAGSGSVVIDLCSRYQITGIKAHLYAGADYTAPTSLSVSASVDGTNYIKVGNLELGGDAPYWTQLSEDAVVGRYVKLDAVSDGAVVLLSEVEAYGLPYVQSADINIAMGKDMIYTNYEGSTFTGLLNDGLASDMFQLGVNDDSWFGFRNSGNGYVDNVIINDAATGAGRGIITIDLAGQAEVTDLSIHLFAGANDAGAVQPRYINVYYSTDGSFFEYKETLNPNVDADGAYWLTTAYDEPVTTRYIKLAVGTMPGDLVLMNEIKVGGLMISDALPDEPGSLSTAVLSGDFNNWNPTPNMLVVDEQLVTLDLQLEAGTYEFKILYNSDWYGNGGTIVDSTGDTPWVMYTTANNCTLNTSRAGIYRFTFNRETAELAVSYIPTALYLRGSFNEWGTTMPMTNDGNGYFSTTIQLDAGTYEYKIAEEDYFIEYPSNNATLTLEKKSDVTFTLNFYTGEITTTVVEVPVVIPTLTLNYPTLAFEAEILYNAYFTVSDASSVVEFGMVTFASRLVDGTIADAVDMIPGYATAGNYHIVSSNGIPAKNLGDALY
ncbi:MAG: CHAP domain-containing protein, partial [Oscillospiraceae bacterium]|nr:CHAP domain-containing protein [Oscillospiraceae bacterium]